MSLTKDLLANYFWPRFIGGTDRKYELLKTGLVPGLLEKVRAVVASGAVEGVVDSVWDMEDALKVLYVLHVCSVTIGTLISRRRVKESRAIEQEAKW